ncbi:uncharacterized protein LOC9637256 [Selaginella moellendorffii]|nr:uncharacterized protein LOC9637256 [Selaginella moellendorffii]|eukprot:XP_002972916.2 uncharacterized protein LOC9637256 [Selaginella moellendorffii]
MSAALGALGGQLVVCPHNSCWRWPRGDADCAAASTSAIFGLSSPGAQLRSRLRQGGGSRRHSKCMAFAEERVRVLDADGASAADDDGGGKSAKPSAGAASDGESMPLLKPSPKPMIPLSRPKPVMMPPPPPPPANGGAASNQMRRPGSGSSGSFAQVYRPRENAPSAAPSQQGHGGGAMQNLDKVLQSAERLANSPPTNSPSSRPVMGRQQSFQQPGTMGASSSFQQQGGFQTRWKKGDPVTPVNGANSSAVKSKPVAPKTPPQTNFPKPPESSTAVKVSQDLPKAPPQTDVSASKQAPPAAPFPRVSSSSQTPAPAPPPGVSSSPQTPAPAPSPGVSPSSQAPAPAPAPSPGVSPSSQTPALARAPGLSAPPRTPILSSPPLMRPPPVLRKEPLMSTKPMIAPKPAAPPVAPKGPRLVDTFRKVVEPSATPPPPPSGRSSSTKSDEATKKQTGLKDKDTGAGGPPSSKPGLANKARDDKRKRSEVMDGAKRRTVARDENAMDDAEEIGISISGVSPARKGRKYSKARRKAERAEAAKASAPVKVEILEVGKQGMTVGDLASKLAINEAAVVKVLFMKGIAVTINQMLDEESVKIVCNEYEVEVIEAGSVKVEDMAKKQKEFLDEEDLESLERRPPVVTVMGHVDHGKTSLLDYIRKTKVAAGEAGGITQAIGAYQVPVTVDGEEQTCVFLDTPGHQAFSAMRARGARITDIAIIVVAADDGTRPQTLEAIAHAKAARVPIVVAINKIDKPGANVDRVKEELAKAGVVPPEWGGEEQMVSVSALTGENIDSLLETVMLVAELQDLRSNPHREASGTIIEASLDKARGPVATLLVQNGTLSKGDVVLCGESYGKVRALFDEKGKSVNEAGPSTAVQVIGLSSVPVAGYEFEIRDTIDDARDAAAEYAERMRDSRLASQASEGKVTLANLASAVASGKDSGVESHQLNIVLKVDVQGTVEAIREALQVLPQDTVQLRFLMQGTGDITASDIDLAIASGAIVIGFNVRTQPTVRDKADSEGVEIRLYKVIYELVDDMRQAMEGLLKPIQEEVPIGKAEVRAVFTSGSGRVAGCMVTEGKLTKGCGVHVKRGKKTVHTGSLSSLRRVKDVAKEVDAGLECGVGVDGFNEWQDGDTIQAFDKVEKKRTLEDASATVAAALASEKK